MKQRKIFIGLFLILAVLALGVAYAAITAQTLTIGGNIEATTSDANFDVIFLSRMMSQSDSSGSIFSVPSEDCKSMRVEVSGLTTEGQVAHGMVVIRNMSADVIAKINDPVITHANDKWFKIEFKTGEDVSWCKVGSTDAICPSEVRPLHMYVTLLDTPVTDSDIAEAVDTFIMTIDAEAISVNDPLLEYGTNHVS